MPEDKKEVVKETLVVKELLQQPVKDAVTEDGKAYTLVTIEEALTEMLISIREIKKSIA